MNNTKVSEILSEVHEILERALVKNRETEGISVEEKIKELERLHGRTYDYVFMIGKAFNC